MKNNLLYKPEDIFPSLRDEAEVDNLLNNDVYKFFMLDIVLAHPEYVGTPVRWKMTIRNNDIKTADVIPKEKLERQLKLTQEKIQGVSQSDLSYLRGMTDSQ
jgi:nicotinic acid phosphoribosyltransferase